MMLLRQGSVVQVGDNVPSPIATDRSPREEPVMIPLGRRDKFALVMLALAGIVWFFVILSTRVRFDGIYLGLTPLFTLVAGIFVLVRLTKGFSPSSVLLVLAFCSLTLFLEMLLGTSKITRDQPIELDALQRAVTVAASYLIVVFAWIVVFPYSLDWGKLLPERRPLWRRMDRIITATVALGLIVHFLQMAVWIDRVPPAAAMKVTGRLIQAAVLWIHLYLVYKFGLWLLLGRDQEPHMLDE
jgi:hypothetical protein